MEPIIVKRKAFDVIEIISNNIFKCSFKNNIYICYKIDTFKSDYIDEINSIKKLSRTGIKQPKLKFIDKKQGYVVREYVEGPTLFEYILDHDFDEAIYKQIYLNAYYARIAGFNLDYDLKSWIFANGVLYYNSLYTEKYKPELDFTKQAIRCWFLSDELRKYYEKNGVLIDKSRIKEDYAVNKEMVLMTCKFYM